MRTPRAARGTAHLKMAAILLALAAGEVSAAPDFSGVWGMVQHDRLMSFVRAEMYPVMKQAREDGTFAGLSVTTSVQGGEPGIITLNMHCATFAPLDGPPPVAKTLGPQGTAAFLAKGAGLISRLDQSILRRVPELGFWRSQ